MKTHEGHKSCPKVMTKSLKKKEEKKTAMSRSEAFAERDYAMCLNRCFY